MSPLAALLFASRRTDIFWSQPRRVCNVRPSTEQRFRKVADIAFGLLKVQRTFIDKDKFIITDKAGNVNGKALGYLSGMLDALLQRANLNIRDIEGGAALHSVIARMFPAEVVNVSTYFGRLKNIESELEITNGIMLGRRQQQIGCVTKHRLCAGLPAFRFDDPCNALATWTIT